MCNEGTEPPKRDPRVCHRLRAMNHLFEYSQGEAITHTIAPDENVIAKGSSPLYRACSTLQLVDSFTVQIHFGQRSHQSIQLAVRGQS
jgi:hypothetical protein